MPPLELTHTMQTPAYVAAIQCAGRQSLAAEPALLCAPACPSAGLCRHAEQVLGSRICRQRHHCAEPGPPICGHQAGQDQAATAGRAQPQSVGPVCHQGRGLCSDILPLLVSKGERQARMDNCSVWTCAAIAVLAVLRNLVPAGELQDTSLAICCLFVQVRGAGWQ